MTYYTHCQKKKVYNLMIPIFIAEIRRKGRGVEGQG